MKIAKCIMVPLLMPIWLAALIIGYSAGLVWPLLKGAFKEGVNA